MVQSIFEEMGGRYERQGEYILPCLTIPPEKEQSIDLFGRRHLDLSLIHILRNVKISKVTTTLSATIQPMLQKTVLPEREHRQSVWNLQSRYFPDTRHWWLLTPMATMNLEISIPTSLSTVCGRQRWKGIMVS